MQLDHVCEERRYSKYNVTAVNGKPRYVKQEKESTSKEFKKRLAGYVFFKPMHTVANLMQAKSLTEEAGERIIKQGKYREDN